MHFYIGIKIIFILKLTKYKTRFLQCCIAFCVTSETSAIDQIRDRFCPKTKNNITYIKH